jgi:hypothetical protein
MFKALMRSLQNRPLNPWILESSSPTNGEKNNIFLVLNVPAFVSVEGVLKRRITSDDASREFASDKEVNDHVNDR